MRRRDGVALALALLLGTALVATASATWRLAHVDLAGARYADDAARARAAADARAAVYRAVLAAHAAAPDAGQDQPPTRASVRAAVAAWEARGLPDGTLVRFDVHPHADPDASPHADSEEAGWRVEVEVEARRGRAVARATARAGVP